jgi:hypothetical protein
MEALKCLGSKIGIQTGAEGREGRKKEEEKKGYYSSSLLLILIL